MRRYTLFASGVMLAMITGPIAAQDMPPPTTAEDTAPAPPAADVPAFEMSPEQQAVHDALKPDQQSQYAGWPGDVQGYYWSLPEPRQDVFWRLSENDRMALTAMDTEGRANAWQLVEERLQGEQAGPAAAPETMEDSEGEPR